MSFAFGSLFSGIGGMDLGLERAGLQCRWQVEINEHATKVLTKHWPSVPKFRDVREVGRHNLAGVDLITGGDPCQENANSRQHGSCQSPSLGGEFIRIVDECRPRFVLRENPSVVRRDAPWPWFRFRAELERMGYAVLPFRIRACCIGADHRRERLFLLAELQNADGKGLEGNEREVVAGTIKGRQDTNVAGPDRWHATPRICGRTDGVSHRMDRLRGLGNAVVPQIATWIGEQIMAVDSRQ